MAELPNKPTMAEYQKFIADVCRERGWDNRTVLEKMLFLTEEVGEVAKAIRKDAGVYGYAKPDTTDHLAQELIDVMNYVIDIANMYEIDLENAFRDNWQKNASRTWAVPNQQ